MHATEPTPAKTGAYFWGWVLCLLGLDYFSTLAYQPSITYEVAGRLGPLATAVVVAVTLFGLLPVYWSLAGRSSVGRGSLGLLERHVRGWRGKTIVLVLLGFAATDFVMLKSLSLADAAVHVLNHPMAGLRTALESGAAWLRAQGEGVVPDSLCAKCDRQLFGTLVIGAISYAFWFVLRRGFNRNVIVVAVPLVGLYLVLTAMLLAGGVWRLTERPELWEAWVDQVRSGDWGLARDEGPSDGWRRAIALSFGFLPKLALGLSGFELSLMLMPQVRGVDVRQRVSNTRKTLVVAALVMAVLLPTASLVTTLFVPAEAFGEHGPATHRTLAYLAHGQPLVEPGLTLLPWCGPAFGLLYDLVTILVLAFAGTSVMTALAGLLPQFLLRFGMDFRWSNRWGLLLLAFAALNFAVTVRYGASVERERNAYATGVVVLIAGAAASVWLDARERARDPGGLGRRLGSAFYAFLALGFAMVAVAVLAHAGGGLLISGLFAGTILALSVLSRAFRADELRTIGFRFKDETSKLLWDAMRLASFPILVPHRPGRDPRSLKIDAIRAEHQLAPDMDLVLLEVELDDPSDFFQQLDVEVFREAGAVVVRITGSVSVPHAIAAVATELSRHGTPPTLHFGWPELDQLSASWSYLAFGEGNVPWKVRELLTRAEPDASKRPRVVMG